MLFRGVAEDKTKVSLRSKMWSDVNKIAGMFGGGGHVRAAGCTIEGQCGAGGGADGTGSKNLFRNGTAEMMDGIVNVLKPAGLTSP